MNPHYAVKGFLNIGENSVLYGPPALGKTAIVAAIAAHSALGRDFADRYTQKTVVIYFAAEDANGVHKRAYPYLSLPDFSSAPFYVVPGGFDMTNGENVKRTIDFIKAVMKSHNINQSLIIFDTLNRMLGVSDENSSSVIGTYMANAEKIAKATNAACLTIHHSGKGNNESARGSSAILGNADNVFRLARSKEDKDIVHLIPEKTKSLENPSTISFRIVSHFVGTDCDGDTISYPKAVPQGATGVSKNTPANDNKPMKNQANQRQDEVLRVLSEAVQFGVKDGLAAPQIAERTGDGFREIRNNRDSHIKAVKRALQSLVEEGLVDSSGGRFWIKPPSTDVVQHSEV